MQKTKRFLYARRYFFGILIFILLYEFVIVGRCMPWTSYRTSYEFHALDFGFGFGSFLWPGQLYQWICGAPDMTSLSVYHTVLLLSFFAALSAFLSRLVKTVETKDRAVALVLILLFLTGPSTFSVFVTDIGFFEVYWVYLSALCFLFLAYKPLNLLIAPLCVLALMLNYAAMICYVPFFCILLLYKYVTETSKSAKRMLLVSFILCVAVSVPSFGYLVLNTQRNMKYTFDEFSAIMRSRGVKELLYVDIVLYGREKENLPDGFYEAVREIVFYTPGDVLTPMQQVLNFAAFRFVLVLYSLWYRNPLRVLVPLLILLPVVALIFGFCFSELRNKRNPKLRRFVFFCIPALPVFGMFVSLIVSHDTFKWMDFTFLPLFSTFLYVLYREPEKAIPFVRRFVSPFTAPQLGMYAVMYSFCVFHAYF